MSIKEILILPKENLVSSHEKSLLFQCWDLTQDLAHARQMLYHRATSPPFINFFNSISAVPLIPDFF
jgi:hypothetical protein